MIKIMFNKMAEPLTDTKAYDNHDVIKDRKSNWSEDSSSGPKTGNKVLITIEPFHWPRMGLKSLERT